MSGFAGEERRSIQELGVFTQSRYMSMATPLTDSERRAAATFVAAAEAYCGVLDTRKEPTPATFVRAAHRALTSLYLAALDLPDVALESDGPDAEPVTSDAEVALSHDLATATVPYHIYWLVFDPFEEQPAEPVASSLPHDLAEIYRDVRNTTAGWGSPKSQRNALWGMRFAFSIHWGRHAVHAMTAMHTLLYDRYIEALDDA